ncbi:DUF6046 domain-containing protein [Capnocytophaga canimorsus]|uniref:DUF6046 domain-containing protein n=2 Tax=Capnocytophaga TaxID=1016 RepID=UPI000F506021|nr:DUF6046 domain-containing protein [Capnocytophaga canimorsus]AYW36394.1 hypothetical protein D8L92_03095 [Capnocytophaga canimorsus]MDT9500431.1 hypothetical protein [Capnocytophaga canimorsus]
MNNGESIVINLAARYAAAFGIVAVSNAMHQVVVTKEDNKYGVDYFSNDSDFQKVIFEYDKTKLEFNSMINGGETSVFAPPPTLSFSRRKNLVETEINGSDTVVIERWGTKQWDISVQGILVDMDDHRCPDSEIQKIVQLFEHNGIIKVVGEQFYDKGIDSIYIQSVDIRGVEGYSDTIQYTISAKSIKEVGFNLLNDGKGNE